MRSAPPEVVATWPKPNYLDPESQGPDLIVAGLFTLVVALICLGLRLYIRLGVMRKTEMDDWVMVAATVRQRRIPVCCRRAIARCFLCTHEQRIFLHHVEQSLSRASVLVALFRAKHCCLLREVPITLLICPTAIPFRSSPPQPPLALCWALLSTAGGITSGT